LIEGLRATSDKHSWNQDWVLTCMQTGGANREVCRITPDEYAPTQLLPALTVATFSFLSKMRVEIHIDF